MKLNKSKNKGKVHPSPSSSSNNNTNININTNNSININDPISSLNHLLPTAILTLISILSLQDREVLAYMITHSLKSSSLSSSSYPKSKPKKLPTRGVHLDNRLNEHHHHSLPSFDCCCFVCFSSYWNKWNSSPHSELIDQAIEAFEEHLSLTEKPKKVKNSKRREKVIAPADVEEREKVQDISTPERPLTPNEKDISTPERPLTPKEKDISTPERPLTPKEKDISTPERPLTPMEVEVEVVVKNSGDAEEREDDVEVVFPVAGEVQERESGVHKQQEHKGLARKVLPDFIGFFQSRLWNRLWGPNV